MTALVVATGCAGPRQGLLIPVAADFSVERRLTMLAVTNRGDAEEGTSGFLYSGMRSPIASLLQVEISLPTGRKAGVLAYDASDPETDKHFALVSTREVGERSSADSWRQALPLPPGDRRRALVFTHGYNTQFDEAVFRFAQIVDDTNFDGLPVLFSWPSRGNTQGYGYDKESATASRDTMQRLLEALAEDPSIEGVDIISHSVGNWLTMEVLRQLAIAGDKATLERLGAIVLVAPDIDMDVFRSQVARLGDVKTRIEVYVSADDRALRVSRRLFGGEVRVGENTNLTDFNEIGVIAHDITEAKGGFGQNHTKAFGDPRTIAGIGASLASDQGSTSISKTLLSDSIALAGQTLSATSDLILSVAARPGS